MSEYATLEQAQKAITGHYRISCSCGALITSCRCIDTGTQQKATVTDGCDECKKKSQK